MEEGEEGGEEEGVGVGIGERGVSGKAVLLLLLLPGLPLPSKACSLSSSFCSPCSRRMIFWALPDSFFTLLCRRCLWWWPLPPPPPPPPPPLEKGGTPFPPSSSFHCGA